MLRVGFVHGVMKTDTMSILGLALDHGPNGWIDDLDLSWTPNTTDAEGRRYRFGHQARVAQWNLGRLANALVPLFPDVEPLHHGLRRFADTYGEEHRAMTMAKLGLAEERDGDAALVADAFALLQQHEVDMTIFFRGLADVSAPSVAPIREAFYRPGEVEAALPWLTRYAARVARDERPHHERRAAMNATNPKFVLRNYLAQQVIDAAEQGDASGVHELLDVMRRPYDEQPGRESLAARRLDWARDRAGCSMLSCSS